MVGDGGDLAAEDAGGVALEDEASEATVAGGGIPTFPAGSSCSVCCSCVVSASWCVGEDGTSGDVAHAHRVPPWCPVSATAQRPLTGERVVAGVCLVADTGDMGRATQPVGVWTWLYGPPDYQHTVMCGVKG